MLSVYASHGVNYAYRLGYRIPKSSARVLEYIPSCWCTAGNSLTFGTILTVLRNETLAYVTSLSM